MNHRKNETLDYTGERLDCLDENSPCNLYFVSQKAARGWIVGALVILIGGLGGAGVVIWKASAYASQIETLTADLQTIKTSQEAFQNQIVLLLLDIKNSTKENNTLLKSDKMQWRPKP